MFPNSGPALISNVTLYMKSPVRLVLGVISEKPKDNRTYSACEMLKMLQNTPGPMTTKLILKMPKLLTKRVIEPEKF